MIGRFQDFFLGLTEIHELSANHGLLIDADDTLWENNIYFERCENSFFDGWSTRISFWGRAGGFHPD
jgi:hypothetical protein